MSSAFMGNGPEISEFMRKLGLDPTLTKRVIIDINAEDVVRVYVEGYADSRAFGIDPPTPVSKARIYVAGESGPVDVTTHDDLGGHALQEPASG